MTRRGMIVPGTFQRMNRFNRDIVGLVGMSNSDYQWRPFIPCMDIIHPRFPQKEKHIAPRTSPSKGPHKKNNQKESNKLLEKLKGTLNKYHRGWKRANIEDTGQEWESSSAWN